MKGTKFIIVEEQYNINDCRVVARCTKKNIKATLEHLRDMFFLSQSFKVYEEVNEVTLK